VNIQLRKLSLVAIAQSSMFFGVLVLLAWIFWVLVRY
jgi:hypothetical protein